MQEALNIVIIFAPLLFIFILVNRAEALRQREQPYGGWSVTAYALLILFYALAILLSAIPYTLEVARRDPEFLSTLNQALVAAKMDPLEVANLSSISSLPLVGLGLWLPSLIGIILLLAPVRRLFARFIPIDPASPVHAAALSVSVLVAMQLMYTLGIGLTNLADTLAAQQEATGSSITLLGLWAQQLMTAFFAMVGVGWIIRRDWSETLQRLGLVRPRLWQVGLGIALGLAMVPVVILVEQLSSQLNIGNDPGVAKLTEQLLGPLADSYLGIITLGAAAAIGEETIFRGALQPRFGLILTALLFALVHSNYGISISTLVVFILALLLGFVRLRVNTTTTMIIHAVYNMSLGFLAYLGF
jgi:uncharacterized protein